jgi:NADH:ubiquinone oxidoreductase subunit 4 (subunit M)
LILAGCIQTNFIVAFLSALGMVLGAGYSLWLCNRILFGNLKQKSVDTFYDLTRLETYTLIPFLVLTFVLGIFPETVICFLNASTNVI